MRFCSERIASSQPLTASCVPRVRPTHPLDVLHALAQEEGHQSLRSALGKSRKAQIAKWTAAAVTHRQWDQLDAEGRVTWIAAEYAFAEVALAEEGSSKTMGIKVQRSAAAPFWYDGHELLEDVQVVARRVWDVADSRHIYHVHPACMCTVVWTLTLYVLAFEFTT